MAAVVRREPYPDLLGRRDAPEGVRTPWTIHDVPMAPGFAKTQPTGREMFVPVGDNPQERVVRAHEMMHAKVSPAQTWPEWLERGAASEQGLISAEEFRVNELCRRQGFDTKSALLDGSEKFSGERIAEQGLWHEGVYMTAAFAGTARLRPFISGVRKHNPEWADAFRALDARLRGLAKPISTTDLAATTDRHGLAPDGFRFTEQWAVLLDLLANPPEPPEDESGSAEDAAVSTDEEGEKSGRRKAAEDRPPAPFSADDIKKIGKTGRGGRGTTGMGGVGMWIPLEVGRASLNRLAPGGLGKKRRPSDRGRHPRRLHRILTDPQKRVFDSTTRGNGGVVLVDHSGSMRFQEADIISIMEHAPGATVATYSATSGMSGPNLWVVAEKGKMTSNVPHPQGGNGCDGPALDWAIRERQRSSSPIVWVCDGIVTGERDDCFDNLTLECIDKVIRNRVIMVRDVAEAVRVLETLANGGKPARWVPPRFATVWTRITGKNLKF